MASMDHDYHFLENLSWSLAHRFAASTWKTYAGVSLDYYRVPYDHDGRSSSSPHGHRLPNMRVDGMFMATCPKSEGITNVHAERMILDWLHNQVVNSKWPPADRQLHTLHLFTFLSPCSGCISWLWSFLHFLRQNGLMGRIRIVLGYSKWYTPPGDLIYPGPFLTIPWLYELQHYFPNFKVMKIY
ncbi:uncharacterized protein LOC115924328 [Strongylocentrotus purpuratus]|uniref:Activation-induced cytidine deaminase AID domain-containing protein n=1 Tax=Strongylocentrotus purpuratus TaxID=7668 RepID=A0A7M7NW03_STRPU|nr:uncharacterized protein LOC115924328 [Strongylocentrotus purpuratus]